ncbi:MAG: hypothetical protein ACYC6L_10485 [Anaerolineae bacterium]
MPTFTRRFASPGPRYRLQVAGLAFHDGLHRFNLRQALHQARLLVILASQQMQGWVRNPPIYRIGIELAAGVVLIGHLGTTLPHK